MNHIVLAQFGASAGSLVQVLIVIIVVCAILYVAQTMIDIPPKILSIIWIVVAAVVSIVAIKFLAGFVL